MNPYEVVRKFESAIAEYAGSKFAVAVDNCTNALFLCCHYLNVQEVTIPRQTYISVPGSIIHAGGRVYFEDLIWEGSYQLKPYPIIDSACEFSRNMYKPDTYRCLSFSVNKPVNIGKGGMILTDNEQAVEWFRMARYEGRHEVPLHEDTFTMLGWNMYMTPEQAARGLNLIAHVSDTNIVKSHLNYPDISHFSIFHE